MSNGNRNLQKPFWNIRKYFPSRQLLPPMLRKSKTVRTCQASAGCEFQWNSHRLEESLSVTYGVKLDPYQCRSIFERNRSSILKTSTASSDFPTEKWIIIKMKGKSFELKITAIYWNPPKKQSNFCEPFLSFCYSFRFFKNTLFTKHLL